MFYWKSLNCLQHKYGSDCYDAGSFKLSTVSSLCCEYCKNFFVFNQYCNLIISWPESSHMSVLFTCIILCLSLSIIIVLLGVNVVKNKNILRQSLKFDESHSRRWLSDVQRCINTSAFLYQNNHKILQFLQITYGLLRIHPCTYNLINHLVECIWRGQD